MRIALVGPTHPFKGGVAAHTTETARHLAAAGHDVVLVSWSRMYPQALYPGDPVVPGEQPDLPPFSPVQRPLRWDRPWSWWTTGAALRGYDLVVLVVVVPVQVPALLTIARSARRGPNPPAVVAIVHNVAPHETHPGGGWLMNRLLGSMDAVLVHSAEQSRLATGHGARRVLTEPLPPHLPGGLPHPAGREAALARPPHPDGEPLRVLALGIVREYKGFDLLLEAAAAVPDVLVTVAGEQWGDAGETLRALAADPRLDGRVSLRAGYVPGVEVPELLAAHDVLALPYRHATASQNAFLGHAHGLPVLASAVGTFADDVRDGTDGLVVEPGSVAALERALRELTGPGRLDALRAGVPEVDVEKPWDRYVRAVVQLAEPHSSEPDQESS